MELGSFRLSAIGASPFVPSGFSYGRIRVFLGKTGDLGAHDGSMERNTTYIDDTLVINGGAWNRHSTCEVPLALLRNLSESPYADTRRRARAEIDLRATDDPRWTS